jgi:hypothetical protein
MRNLAFALVFVILCASAVTAKNREWKDAKVTAITSDTTNGGVAVIPIGGILAGVPITNHRIFYRIETADMVYILAYVNKKRPLDVTLNGKTKIAIDGHDAHILDDAGKDVKLPIVQKIARTPAEDPGK